MRGKKVGVVRGGDKRERMEEGGKRKTQRGVRKGEREVEDT